MRTIFSIIGAYIGVVATSDWYGALSGFGIGYLFATCLQLKSRIEAVENELKLIRSNLIESQVKVSDSESTAVESPVSPAPELKNESETEDVDSEAPTLIGVSHREEVAGADSDEVQSGTRVSGENVQESPAPAIQPESETTETPRETVFDKLFARLKTFFTTGNVVVKIGVIILFFGVGFLIRYAIERQVLPVEYRLMGIGIGAIIMLVFGWRLRQSRREYALILQGGAVGILYITIFAAAKNFQLIEPAFAFVMMILLVAFSAILAYLQDSRNLAIFGSAGGFIAPILTSTGSGSHVMLFTYYAVLNLGIFGMSWFKAWRTLNWVGFVFTFVIGSVWGARYYQAHYFSSTEPFLILSFVFYFLISIFYAYRQPPQLRGLVDSTLVFGLPLIAFTLQAALVRDMEFGRAYSALGMAIIYIGTARLLWKKQIEGMRLLTEAFLAIGVIFASLAIPYALDGRWTAATWALEGAGAVWIGLRQNRLLTRCFGLLLQIGGAVMFFYSLRSPLGDLPIVNAAYLACLFTSLAGYFTSWYYYRHDGVIREWEKGIHIVLLIWAHCWWFGAGFLEIEAHVSHSEVLSVCLIFASLSFLVFDGLARRLEWKPALNSAIFLLPVMIYTVFIMFVDQRGTHPFAGYGFLSLTLALLSQLFLLHRNSADWVGQVLHMWHGGTFYLMVFVVSWVSAESVDYFVIGSDIWSNVQWGLIPAFFVLLLINFHEKIVWPVMCFRETYLQSVVRVILIYLCLWFVMFCFAEGRPRPLNYLPVINPLELTQLFILFIFIRWFLLTRNNVLPGEDQFSESKLVNVIGIISFLWLNSVIGRAVHFLYGVRFKAESLFDSAIYQASLSIAWTLTALTITALSTRLGNRRLWFVGAALIGAVTVKLFLIDLKDTGTIARIITFLTVGIMLSVIGYLSPVPPKSGEESN